ncbi:GDP-L-fucose synthase [Cyanobium sp. NIES-981]|uniref:GDP-L-fucose synthase family protein n=1 Tax=Cyanobium sp. NIES-981 TaxID=1851505 RepID=UPI0007DDE282|nr:GDP-L-fucose synthase [Cyanobium sp. NIES-981]SBO44561.1 bifunctional GDP-fucose synthetase: GDP-4-dehydro-6-deoxy-D-mannose epimerase and GDP-4-dehydro-6-L-deoxygalactose reductase [Cyanobium sp. NIES-981]
MTVMESLRPLIQPSDRIFVAGHRGMAGSAICRSLLRQGYGNLLTVTRSELDLTDSAAVGSWFSHQRPDVVVLAAAKVGGILANATYPADFLLENLKIQNNVIESAWRCSARRLLFLGSSCIYPKFATQPIREEELLQGGLEPTNEWYAIAKITGIKLCEALRQQHGFDAISLMPTNLYGPGDNYHPQNSHVLPALIRRFHEAKMRGMSSLTCWGSGTPRREFLHVDDLADAAVHCLRCWDPSQADSPRRTDGQPLTFLNVGSGTDLTIAELAGLVADAVGYGGEIQWDTSKPDGTPRKWLDVSRLTQLGWQPRISLQDGLRQVVQAFTSGEVEQRL